MLRYLLKFVCVYLYMYMLCTITFGYTLFHEIFIHVKLIFFLILKGTCNHSIENALKSPQFPHTIHDRIL